MICGDIVHKVSCNFTLSMSVYVDICQYSYELFNITSTLELVCVPHGTPFQSCYHLRCQSYEAFSHLA